MANLNFDLDRLLTGVSNRPMEVQRQPIPGSPNFRGEFGAQIANDLQAGLGNLVRGGRPTQAQQLNQAEAKYRVGGTIADMKELLKMQVMREDRKGAAATATKIQALLKESSQKTASTNLINATKKAITQKYGEKRTDLLDLADQGMSLTDVDSFAETDMSDKYKIVGNNVLEVATGKFLPTPKGAGKGGYTISKFYDPKQGANVIQFLDKDDPTIVLDEKLDTKDIGRQSTSLLKLQDENLKLANAASKEAIEANAVALKLEKAAEMGTTGGVIAQGEEFIKSILGSEDETTLLRKSADRLRVSRGIANLPVGPASDKDVALVMGGELSATANPATVAAYVRGIAKLAKAERDFYNNQNAWLDRYKDNGGFSSYMSKEQLEKQLGHSSIVAAEKKLAEVNYDTDALAIFEQKFGFDYMAAKKELDRANKTLETLKREDF
tara:strand:+ start:231 stop:1550 length:1320 start_codon:yes stop_codon:yes gene_type:complete